MSDKYGTSGWQEISQRNITLDPRTLSQRLGWWLRRPRNLAAFQIGMALGALVFAFVWLPITVVMVLVQLWYSWQRHDMPMRYPKDLGGFDPSLDSVKPNPKGKGTVIERKPADGILYIGNQRSPDRAENLKELWATNDDARTHMLLMGTTGSGKTVTLLSLCFNALAWGSGFFYSDGKADSSLHAAVWNLCRRVGREDDYLVLNFMTGGADPYKKKKTTEKSSNGTNPWSEGGPDFLSQLSSSLLPKANGDGAQWQQKAVNMMDALIRTLCYERAVGNITLSIGVIREYLALPNLVKLYLKGKKGEIPEFAFLPIKAYLETGLPGFRPDLADKPDKWDQTVWDQHGYLTGQYARTLSMLMDTYGYIFKDKYSEVDMMDVLLNRRVLVVMIPTLEKSAQEAANLGKLVVSSIRLMMAMNLGHRLEGTYEDVIETKATQSPAPYIITMDELGYYFAEGIALMFAQARSLGFMMIAAGQDIAAMAKGDNKEEVDSMIANTKIKYSLALEDPEKTLEVFKKVAGEAISVEVGSFEGSVNNFTSTHYRRNLSGSIQRRDRLELRELKALKPMEGVLIFQDQVTRARSFTWFDSATKTKLPFRLNRFLQVDRPTRADLSEKMSPIDKSDRRFTVIDGIMGRIRKGRAPEYLRTTDPLLEAVLETYRAIEANNPNESPVNRGIAYYTAAVEAMRSSRADEDGRYWEPIAIDPSTIDEEPPIEWSGEDVAEGGQQGAGAASGELKPSTGAYNHPPLREMRVVNDARHEEPETFANLIKEFSEPSGGARTAPSEKQLSKTDSASTERRDAASTPTAAPGSMGESQGRAAQKSSNAVSDRAEEQASTDPRSNSASAMAAAAFDDTVMDLDALLRSHVAAQEPEASSMQPEPAQDQGNGPTRDSRGEADGSAALEAIAQRNSSSSFGTADAEAPAPPESTDAMAAPAMPPATESAQGGLGESNSERGEEIVIGFTERATDMLVKIEAAHKPDDDPVASVKEMEAEVSEQLRWTKPVDEMSLDDLDDVFGAMEANIRRSASRA